MAKIKCQHYLAYNLGNLLRWLCLPRAVKHWSLRSLQVKLIKIGGRLGSVDISRYSAFPCHCE